MVDLSTQYMGLCLKNPVIAGSSRLTGTLEGVLRCEEAGAGAVILKSLFEEQILFDSEKMIEGVDTGVYTDAFDFLSGMSRNYHLDRYLTLLEDAKKRLSVPVIASINCVNGDVWPEYAKKLESVGADALEVNMFLLPSDIKTSARDIEKRYLETARKIKRSVHIPVSMKIGPHFSALGEMVEHLADEGIDGVVFFNRFYRPDIDIETMKFASGGVFSDPKEVVIPLRWIALLSGEVHLDLVASTGVHDYTGVVKNLLVGAKAVQLCSVLFTQGLGFLADVVAGLEKWMEAHSFGKITDFQGILCQENIEHPEIWERSQYIKALTGIS